MSILNAFIYPDHAFVCVDTETVLPGGGPRFETSKLFAVPHLNAVIGLRGTVLLNSMLMAATVLFDGDFDGLSQSLPGLLNNAVERAIALGQCELVTPETVASAEVVAVGFSRARGRIVLNFFKSESLDVGFVAYTNITGTFSAPSVTDPELDIEHLRRLPGGEGLKTLGLAQVRMLREREPQAAAGGRLILAEIRQDGMKIGPVCEIPARPESTRQQAAEGGVK